MATTLTPAHKSWRIKVFIATWLSYVGFYFCRKGFSIAKSDIGAENHWSATTLGNIWAAYLIAYAIGQYVASELGTKLGPRRNVLIGMALSVLVTMAMGLNLSVPVLAGMAAINGLAQATGWSGNVGTMAAWFHRHERGRVMGLWSTNFTVGSLAATLSMAWVLGLHDQGSAAPWRWVFYFGAGVLALIWIQFYFLQRNRPEDVGLSPVEDPLEHGDEPVVQGGRPKLSRDAWINLLLVGGFYFCAKFVRYAVWSWSAYFLKENYHLSSSSAANYSMLFDLMGIPGVWATGWLSERYFKSRRAGVSLIFMLAMCVATGLLIGFGSTSVTVFAVLLGAVGFTLYGPDALLSGAGAMDIGGRHAATYVTAVIALFGALGPVVQEVIIARMYDSKGGELGPIFVMLFVAAALAAAFCAALVLRNRRGAGI